MNLKALSTIVTTFGIVFLIFASNSVCANAKKDYTVFSNLPTMGPPPAPIDIYIIGALAIFLVLFVAFVVIRYRSTLRKHIKLLGIITLIAIIVVSGVCLVWFAEPTIKYSIDSAYTYPRVGDNYLTVNCENVGYFSGTFDLVVYLENVILLSNVSVPYQAVDSTTAKFTFTLQSGEKQSAKAYFSIKDNVADFYFTISFQQNNNFFIRSELERDDFVSYQKNESDDNFTKRFNFPPP